MSDFKTREDWLVYRARNPKRITWAFVSVKPHPRIKDEFIGATYSIGKTKEKIKRWVKKIEARNARRAAKLARRKGPMEAVSIE